MAGKTNELEATAGLHEGLAHPFRMAIYHVLRSEGPMVLAELRKAVGDLYTPLDARNLQFHLFKMQVAGIVVVQKEAGRDTARLMKEIVTRAKDVNA